MTRQRSATLRRINLMIGTVLVVAGVAGGFLLTFWFLVLLLPMTCAAASWMMAWTSIRSREGHTIIAIILTALLLAWFVYFLQNGAATLTWYGILIMWTLLAVQAAIFLSVNRPQIDSADAIDS
jgi:hypothetical protein